MTDRAPKYFHLVYHGLERTVIEAQLITPALHLKEQGIDVELIIFEDIVEWLRLFFDSNLKREKQKILHGLAHSFWPRVPRNLFYANTFQLLLKLTCRLLRRPVVLHARGLQGANAAVPLKKMFSRFSLICDIRGIESEEYAYTKQKQNNGKLNAYQQWWQRCLEQIAINAINHADVNFCVSRSMIEYWRSHTEVRRETRWQYVPCAVEVERFIDGSKQRDAVRRELGLQGRLIATYSGAVRPWQMPEQAVQLFVQLRKIEPLAFFLALTPDVAEIEAIMNESGVAASDYRVMRVPFSEIPKYLSIADVGFLLREENPLNKFSCPTKFGEYLACGLFVITTSAIDDVAKIVRDNGVGALADDARESTIGLLQRVVPEIRAASRIDKSQQAARELFDWDRYIPEIKKWYLELPQKSSREK